MVNTTFLRRKASQNFGAKKPRLSLPVGLNTKLTNSKARFVS